jgi:hypothetical protein
MTASAGGYEPVRAWGKGMLGRPQAPSVRTIAWLVLWVLLAQRVTPAALARALPAEQAGRARLTRVRRWGAGPPWAPTVLSPQAVPAALALRPPAQPVVVALATPRRGPWEVWLAGSGGGGRPVPRGWAVMPYPWPTGRCRTTTVALLQRVQRAFPPSVAWSWVADRGCPRAVLCAPLRPAGTACGGRGRAGGTGAGVYAMGAAHGEAGRRMGGQRTTAALGRGRLAPPLGPGWGVVRAAVVVSPQPKQTPGTERERTKRAKAQAPHRARPSGRHPPPPRAPAQRSAQPWVWCTTAPTGAHAGAEDPQRRAMEETWRDWHRGWGVRAAVGPRPTATMVERRLGGGGLT